METNLDYFLALTFALLAVLPFTLGAQVLSARRSAPLDFGAASFAPAPKKAVSLVLSKSISPIPREVLRARFEGANKSPDLSGLAAFDNARHTIQPTKDAAE